MPKPTVPKPVVDKKWIKGPVNKVKCPHCGERQDLSQFTSELEKTPKFECDDCGEYYEVVRTQKVQMVWVRSVEKPESAPKDDDGEDEDEDGDDDGCSAPDATSQPT